MRKRFVYEYNEQRVYSEDGEYKVVTKIYLVDLDKDIKYGVESEHKGNLLILGILGEEERLHRI